MENKKTSLDEILNIRNSMIEQFELWLNNFGIYPNLGRIFLTMLFDKNPLTQEELASGLNVSQSTISRNLKILTENYPLISKSFVHEGSSKKTGKRKWEYKLSTQSPSDLIIILFNSLIEKFKFSQMIINSKIALAEKIDESKHTEEEKQYINQIKTFFQNFNIINEFITEEFNKVIIKFQESVGDKLKPI